MKLGRIFASAVARRIAYVVVALALASLGLDQARAQDYSNCNTTTLPAADGGSAPICLTRAQAIAAAIAHSNAARTSGTPDAAYYLDGAASGDYTYVAAQQATGTNLRRFRRYPNTPTCPAGQFFNPSGGGTCSPNCTGRAPEVFTHSQRIPGGSHGCKTGCQFVASNNGDGTYTRTFGSNANYCNVLPDCLPGEYLNVATSLCFTPEAQCGSSQIKNPTTGECETQCPAGMHADADGLCVPDTDDCPAGHIRAPSGQCLPGDGQCAVGEARRDNGTCGKDSDGDGNADEDDEDTENDPDKESASGGDSCNAPPSCSGGAIECMQVKIQWRIDCNTRRKVNISGGACSAMPVCTGENCNAMEYSQLLQQWRAACALEKMADQEEGEGGNQDLIDLLTGPGSIEPDLGGTGDMPGGGGYEWGDDEEFEPDTGGFGWSSSCPANPSVNVFGATLTFNLSPMCQWVGLGGYLVMILAGLASLRIVSGGNA